MPTPQPPHSLGLHASHAQEVLRIGEVRRQLGELRVQVGLHRFSHVGLVVSFEKFFLSFLAYLSSPELV